MKDIFRFAKFIGLLFFIGCLVLIFSHPTSAASAPAGPMGIIDNPGAGDTMQGVSLVRGWFLDESGVSKVDVYVDNQYQGSATYGYSRPDVNNVYPQYGNSNAGYQFNLDTRNLANGTHVLSVTETGKNGIQTTVSRTVTVSALTTRGIIDDPSQNRSIEGVSLVRGWFLDGSGVSKVDVSVDGQYQGTATYGISRSDVNNVYPQYTNSNAGYQFNLDTHKLTNGTHTLTVTETGANGVQTTLNRTVTVLNARGVIDNPGAGDTLSRTSLVRGWFLDGSGVSKVDVSVDGQYQGSATYGYSRPDVNTAYPLYGNTTSGYQFNLDTSKLTVGSHELTVTETGADGEQTTVSRTVNVSALTTRGVIDDPSQNSSMEGVSTIRGWFLDGSGVSKVDVSVDGQYQGTATYGISRLDVNNVYPQYTNSNAGYQYSLDTYKLSDGTHTLSVTETGANGVTTTINRTVSVLNTRGAIDNPGAGSTILGTSLVRGWFLDGSGVSKVDVYVDNQYQGSATCGYSRSDVYNAYPQYGNSNAGYQFNLNTHNLTYGTHVLTVKETGGSGIQTTLSRTVTVLNAQGVIDNPSDGSTVQGVSLVRGWFLDGSGVSKVDVYVDGQYQGSANYGYSRPDVNTAYPLYGNNNAGYQFYLKSYLLSAGSHTLTVKETGADGEQLTINRSVIGSPPPGGAIQEGIDVSNNNGPIDFQAVRDSGVSFVIAKATEGTNFQDWTFKTNMANAAAAGLKTSAYHFFQSTNDPWNARNEANQFAAMLNSIGFNGYAFVDVEITNSGDTKASVTNSVSAFLDQLKRDGISKIGVYSYLSYFNTYLDLPTLQSNFPGLMVWTAAWHSADQGPQMNTDLWQFTDSGSVNGVSGSVDMDLLYNPLF